MQGKGTNWVGHGSTGLFYFCNNLWNYIYSQNITDSKDSIRLRQAYDMFMINQTQSFWARCYSYFLAYEKRKMYREQKKCQDVKVVTKN